VSGKTLDLTAFRVECSGCVIKNVNGRPVEEGVLQLKEVTLTEPEPTKCGVTGSIETKKLKGTVGMKSSSSTIATIKFAPESGTTLATVEILGGSCSIAGTYNLTGAFFAEMSNSTATFAKSQPLKLSKAIQESAGTAASMKFGESNAFLNGTVNAPAGTEYAAKLETNQFSESGSAWYTGASPGTKLAEGTTKTITTKAATKVTMETSLFGGAIKLEANSVGCSTCVIKNVGSNALEEVTLQLKEASMSQPAGCSVPETITTKRLKGAVGMNKAGTIGTVKYVPESGIALFTLEISGASCAIAGTYKITGTLFGELTNATGVFSSTQRLKLSRAVQESAGTASSMTFGENPLFFTGEIDNSAEVEYAAKEK
jgi:hypothetical protein